MTKSKLDMAAHKELLKRGESYCTISEHSIHIDRINSYVMGNGFGTAMMREIVQLALKEKKTITLGASYASHIFHLYMGMIPIERNLSYVDVHYGFLGMTSIQRLNEYHTVEDLTNSQDLNELLEILKIEKNLPEDKKLTAQDVLENKDFLLDLTKRNVSYITFNFIPQLLQLFEKGIGDKFPDTSSLFGVQMQLSKEGQERWQEAIDEGIEFTPFKGFEQLHPFMKPNQREQLDSLLKQRPVALAISAIHVDFKHAKTRDEIEAHKVDLLKQIDTLSTSNDLLQNTIKNKKKIIEQSAHERIQEIESARMMVQSHQTEELPQPRLKNQSANEPQLQALNKEQERDNTVTSQVEQPIEKTSEETSAKTTIKSISEDINTKLINIVSILIKNISEGAGGRYTSSTDHKKVSDLKSILNTLKTKEESGKTQNEYVREILDVCKIKRNSMHFWATPHSVDEFKALLKENKMKLPSENKSCALL